MKTYPHSEAMKRRVKRHTENGPQMKMSFILALECQVTTAAFYGGHIRAGFVQIKHGVIMGAQSIWIRSLCWLTDRVGWTKLVPIEPGSEYKTRHGGQCDKMNCGDMDCLNKGIPVWFRWMTRWDK